MKTHDYEEPIERVGYDFGLNRRNFVQILGTGLLVAVGSSTALGQRQGRGGFAGLGAKTIGARIHLGKDGSITVLAGKVEGGQGARTELTQAAAEELRVAPDKIQLVLADTALVPDDGMTAGSRSSPVTVPAVRYGATAARNLLLEFASKKWSVEKETIEIRDGKAVHNPSGRTFSYADLASDPESPKAFGEAIPTDVTLTPVKDWKALGHPASRPNGAELVTGAHQYPSDVTRPGMLYGKILRPLSYGAKLTSIDLAQVKPLKDVVVAQDDQFVGIAAPTSSRAEEALALAAKAAKWETSPHPSSKQVFDYLKEHARGGLPSNPFTDELAAAKQVIRQTYQIAYAQHAPLEPRAAVAEWADDKLTVWMGTQSPFGCQAELVRAFHLPEASVRVIVPDFGAGFGGKHSGEVGVEAARLAKAAGHPVSLRWTREEEFTWAYFRPAALIETEASLDANGSLTSWHFVNVNAGGAGVETPYRTGKDRSRSINSTAPLRQGSYRALAATGNNFAREIMMDELAAAAGKDPLEFRLAHLEERRLRAVLEDVAKRFDWAERVKTKSPTRGVGLACGTEKGSYVAACVEIEIDHTTNRIGVLRVFQTFECGAILNPDNLLKQNQGAIIMGLGPALREEVRFENGEILTNSFGKYPVPRFNDVPELDIRLVERPDLPSSGAGETPIIAVAPAIANAVFHATGTRIRTMPIRLPAAA